MLYHLPRRTRKNQGVSLTGLLALCAVLLLTHYAASLTMGLLLHLPLSANPLAWLIWCIEYRTLASIENATILYPVYGILLTGTLGSVVSLLLLNYRHSVNKPQNEAIHGSAHFATPEEITATGLLSGDGVYTGAWEQPEAAVTRYLRHDGPEHVMVFAPTRSGKGVGLVIPTLLSWPESVLVHDIKGENWALTSGWRARKLGSLCLKFDPANHEASTRFNPLEEIRLRTIHEVKDVQNIAAMIVDPDGKGLNDHWAKTGFSLLVGTILHVLYAEKDKTLRGVASYLSSPRFKEIREIFEHMMHTLHDSGFTQGWRDSAGRPTATHPVVAESAKDMLNKAANECSGVLSTAMSFLTLYRDPIIARNTAVSDFRIRDLMQGEKPLSLYIVVSPSDKDRLKPLVRLIINQTVRVLTEKMAFENGQPIAHYKHRLLMMIDEFPALGKLDIFAESLAFIAGYGIKAYLITQDVSQLYKEYGEEESIISNCHIRIAYAPNKIETAELLSKMTGTMTVIRENLSFSGGRLSPMLSSMTSSEVVTERPLLTPDETMRLPDNVSLVFVAGHPPIYGQKIRYFLDGVFRERSQIPPPELPRRMEEAAISEEELAIAKAQLAEKIPPPINIDDILTFETEQPNDSFL